MKSKELGNLGEMLATALFQGLGFVVLARNARVGRDEIDLIVAGKSTIVFVEVKTRTPGIATGIEAITPAKRARMQRAGMRWLAQQDTFYPDIRFDAIEVTVDGSTYAIQHVPEVV